MQLFHLGNSKYARELSGEGARLFGGRWNQKGYPCIYTSATRSLCILEYLANVTLENMPPGLSITEYSIPDNLCQPIAMKDLPVDWASIPPPVSTKILGSTLLSQASCTCFAVPSVLVPEERNYILNPASRKFSEIKIIAVNPFLFDHRIKK